MVSTRGQKVKKRMVKHAVSNLVLYVSDTYVR